MKTKSFCVASAMTGSVAFILCSKLAQGSQRTVTSPSGAGTSNPEAVGTAGTRGGSTALIGTFGGSVRWRIEQPAHAL
jgi:hypothetical protein